MTHIKELRNLKKKISDKAIEKKNSNQIFTYTDSCNLNKKYFKQISISMRKEKIALCNAIVKKNINKVNNFLDEISLEFLKKDLNLFINNFENKYPDEDLSLLSCNNNNNNDILNTGFYI
jgi:hypothetical protein